MVESNNIKILNKKAQHDYFILERVEAGLVLKGSEVKSIREGRANIKEAYVRFIKDEAFVVGMHISEYNSTSEKDLDVRRTRKLLLHKSQLRKLMGTVSQKGHSIIPTKLYFVRGRAKMEIALCKGKKQFDKRESIKKRTQLREMDRALKR